MWIDHAPVANDDFYRVPKDTPLHVGRPGVQANDSDPDNDFLVSSRVSGPSQGALTFNADGSFDYVPDSGFTGTDGFTYFDTDVYGLDSNIATVTIAVSDTPVPPIAKDDSYSVVHDHTLTVDAPGVLANDLDAEGGTLTAHLVSGPSHGSLTLNADGSFTYTPDQHYKGDDSFTYKANNGLDDSNVATVALTVTNVAPQAADAAFTVLHDHTLTVSAADGLLNGASDDDGDALTAALVSGPTHGSVSVNADGSFTYTPAAHFAGTDSFTFKVNDGIDDSDPATVTIDVTNEAPVALDDSYDIGPNHALTVPAPGVLGNDYDPDDDAITASLVSGPQNGTLSLNADGSFTYTPDQDFHGTDTFTYQVSDGLATSDPATVTLNVADRPPVAVDDFFYVLHDQTLDVAAGASSPTTATPTPTPSRPSSSAAPATARWRSTPTAPSLTPLTPATSAPTASPTRPATAS
jgi:VCBS repeat-containing protein